MGDFKIGSSDYGLGDWEDNLYVRKNPLKTGLTANEAERYVRDNPGAEVLIKQKDGTFSVYRLRVDEEGKKIQSADFEDGSIELTRDVLNVLGGEKAYVSTSTNYLRTLDIPGIEIDGLDQEFARANFTLDIQDKDGIETSSQNDIQGTLKGSLVLDNALIRQAVAQASKETGLDTKLHTYSKSQKYEIDISYGIFSLGTLSLEMEKDGIWVDADGVVAGIAEVADRAAGVFGYDLTAMVESFIKKFATGMGFKVKAHDIDEYKLTPDLKNSPLMGNLGAGDVSLTVEKISLNPDVSILRVLQGGHLQINLDGATVTASSDHEGAVAKKADAEGPDQVNISVSATLYNDWLSHVEAEMDARVNITPEESAAFGQKLQALGGSELNASGELGIQGAKVDATLDSKGKIKSMTDEVESVRVHSLNLDSKGTTLKLDADSDRLSVTQEGSRYDLVADGVGLTGQLDSQRAKLTIKSLQLAGTFSYDQAHKDQVGFSVKAGQPATFSGEIKEKNTGQTIGIQGLKLADTRVDFDLQSGQLDVVPTGNQQKVTLSRLSLPNSHLTDLSLSGELHSNVFEGGFSLAAKSARFKGQIGQIEVKRFSGRGQIDYRSQDGLSIKNARIDTQLTIGDFAIPSLKGSGNVHISPDSKVVMSQTQDLELVTGIGLSVKGNLQIGYADKQYKVETTSDKPVMINYIGEQGEINLSDVQFHGQMTFDERTNVIQFASHKDKPLLIPEGMIAGAKLNAVSMENGVVSIKPGESFSIEPLPGQTLTAKGSINDIPLESLQSSGVIVVKPKEQAIQWSEQVSVRLPELGVDELQTQGPISLSVGSSGEIILDSQGASITGKFGQLKLDNMVVNGKLIYEPKTGNIRFQGVEEQPFSLSGKINGSDMQVNSSGFLNIEAGQEHLILTGEKLKIQGLVDGFCIESPEGVSGKLVMPYDFSTFDLKDLNFDIRVDDVALHNEDGLIKSTAEGYEINLSGNLSSRQEQLMALLDKVAHHGSMTEDVKASVQSVQDTLAAYVSQFGQADIHYEDLKILFDKDFNFQGFTAQNTASMSDVKVPVLMGGQQQELPLGNVTWVADICADKLSMDIQDGVVDLELNPELRVFLAEQISEQLGAFGFSEHQVSVEPNGDIKIENATINRNKLKGKATDDMPRKVKGISATLNLSVRVENNQLQLELEELKIKQMLAQVLNKIVGGKNKVADQVAQQLTSENIEFEREKKDAHFTIDLNALIQSQVGDEGIQLQNAVLSEDGRLLVQYTYQADL